MEDRIQGGLHRKQWIIPKNTRGELKDEHIRQESNHSRGVFLMQVTLIVALGSLVLVVIALFVLASRLSSIQDSNTTLWMCSMKKKLLIFFITLTIISSLLVFKLLPAKVITYSFSSPPDRISILPLDDSLQKFRFISGPCNNSISTLAFRTDNLDITLIINDYPTNSNISSYSLSIHSSTLQYLPMGIYFYLYDNGASYQWNFDISNTNIPPLVIGKTYSFKLIIKGKTIESANTHYIVDWNINTSGYFYYQQPNTILPINSKDVSLSFQSYNCDTHIATFNVNVQGYNFVDESNKLKESKLLL
ncbi:hypothetical protein [Caldisericum exile]|uniref:hypothetical protein n=1 Tax=Caldisericum exile TaxID=693075 RepID=UPI003C78F515